MYAQNSSNQWKVYINQYNPLRSYEDVDEQGEGEHGREAGIPLSQGTLTWHFPQPYRGLCFSFVRSRKAEQSLWIFPFSKEMACTGQFLIQAPHLVQYASKVE